MLFFCVWVGMNLVQVALMYVVHVVQMHNQFRISENMPYGAVCSLVGEIVWFAILSGCRIKVDVNFDAKWDPPDLAGCATVISKCPTKCWFVFSLVWHRLGGLWNSKAVRQIRRLGLPKMAHIWYASPNVNGTKMRGNKGGRMAAGHCIGTVLDVVGSRSSVAS